ncbi:hypothetical protein LPJ61_002694 [Coemansia biformis]|uniref:DH domain-containing protein n=1 Tax=Coemansia biformis TaxID=1286918 RepID=A0A9W7YFA0_9FUNG|nr:hypothetical protein LPJ61_002694 [Coemansia biformis]
MVLLPTMRAGKRDSQDSARRPSAEVRTDHAAGSPAKARMLWREGFTPLEMANSSMNAKEMKRQEVIFEIIHTEADYVRDLSLIVDVLMGPLHSLRIVPPEQVDLIFGNVGEILALHEEINAAFMERQRQQYPVVWDIADVLLPFVAGFRVYARYICNQDRALALVGELKSECNNFAVFWKERQKRPECRGLPMESFLALPFQRLLKYPLLLRTLLDSTEGWSQQYANGTAVAEQVDGWIAKIQDAQTKLDSFACIDALSRAVVGVDWAPLLGAEHRLAHSGPVRATLRSATGGLAPEQPATMWLFDTFAIIAAGDSAAGRGFMPAPNTRYTAVLRPSRIVEVLELAQYKGTPAAHLRVVPADAPSQTVSVVLGFASRADYTLWRSKLDEHVRHTLELDPGLSADILADAIARARIVDSEPTQCAGVVRSPLDSGLPSANASTCDIPTITVRDVYVQFPEPHRRGKLRRGWDMLRSKTEDITGNGIKHQLRKYGGGGKRRATESPKPSAPRRLPRATPKQGSPLARPKPASGMISTPIVPPSPSFVHIPRTAGPSAANGGHESSAFVPPRRPLAHSGMGTHHPHRHESRASVTSVATTEVTSPMSMQHQLLLSSLEFGSAAMACAAGAPQSMSARTSFTGRTLSNAPGAATPADPDESDLEFSDSEVSAMFPEHAAERSGSTLFSPPYASQSQLVSPPRMPALPSKPLPIPPALPPASRSTRSGFSSRKPGPVFEIGSARLTYGTPKLPATIAPSARGSRDRTGSMPLFYDPADGAPAPGDRWQTAFREPARGWSIADADSPSSANSTESFCIISPGEPRQSSDRHGRTQTFA